jgi:hypothetical protein
LAAADDLGLLDDAQTTVVSTRVPKKLLAAARGASGARSIDRLLILALALVATQENFGAWLLAHKGTVDPSIDLEF